MTETIFLKTVLEVLLFFLFSFTQVPFVCMESAGFMTCTAASHQGATKEPASLLKTHPVETIDCKKQVESHGNVV